MSLKLALKSYFIFSFITMFLIFSSYISAQQSDWQSLTKTAQNLTQQKKYDEALNKAHAALRLARHKFKNEHGRISTSYEVLGDIYFQQDQFEMAKKNYEKALKIEKKYHGEFHSAVARYQGVMANFYFQQNEFTQAEKLYQQAISIFKQAPPEKKIDYQRLANLNYELGKLYIEKHATDPALEVFAAGLPAAIAGWSEDHEFVGRFHFILGRIYKKQRNDDQALIHLEKAIEIFKKTYSVESPLIQDTQRNLVELYQKMQLNDKLKKIQNKF